MPPRLWIRIAELTFAFLLALAVFSSWRADCRDPKILKPLYDFTIDCKACQAKLSAAQGNLTDERKKTTALIDTVFTISAEFLRYNPRTESYQCRPPTFRQAEPRQVPKGRPFQARS
jgi:hypothetical protein